MKPIQKTQLVGSVLGRFRSEKLGVLTGIFIGIFCAVFPSCLSPSAAGPRTVTLPNSPVIPVDGSPVGPPAPIEIDQDSLAGQIVAKLEARLQVMLSAVANVASGNTTYYGWGAAGIAGFAWFVQLLTTRRFAQLAEMNVKLSHEREMRRIECNIAHGKED